MSGSRGRNWVVAVVMVVALVACGGGGGTGAKTVSAKAYVASICGGLQTWLDAIQQGAVDLTQGLSSDATPVEGKAALAEYLDGLVAETEVLIQASKDAGIPDVDGGADFAKQVTTAFESAKKALEDARSRVDELPTDDATAFSSGADELGTSINASLGDIGASYSGVSQPELKQAFDTEPSCTSLGA